MEEKKEFIPTKGFKVLLDDKGEFAFKPLNQELIDDMEHQEILQTIKSIGDIITEETDARKAIDYVKIALIELERERIALAQQEAEAKEEEKSE